MPRRLVPRWESKRVQSSTDIWATSASVDNDLDSDIPAMSGFGSSSSTECGDDGRETEAAGRKGRSVARIIIFLCQMAVPEFVSFI